ncbi:zinc finger, CCHC-type containing protein [Tanacetum coccineum]
MTRPLHNHQIPFLNDVVDAPQIPLNPIPLQSHPYLDITLSLSPITPLNHIPDTPSPPSLQQPPQPPLIGNKKYFMTFIDDASRFCYVYFLHTKDEALDKFKVFKNEVELQQGSLFKRFRTDRGCEYMDTLYFHSIGIIHETTAPYTPQQNGISERKNKVLKEMVNFMLSYSGLSQGFWGEAILTACYLLNRVPNKRNMITPYELWTKKKPNLNYLRVWGCRAVVRLRDPKLKTLGERGIECIFFGYVEHSKDFKFYVIEPNDSVLINSIIESRDAIFDENRFFLVPRPSLTILNGTEDTGGPVVLEEVTEEADPKTFDEAMKSQDVALWKEAINDEMDSIMGNNTWVLADQPPGIDYFDTYAPVVRINTIRLFITMASIHNLIIHQIDVKTAFLNGKLEEEVDLTKEFLSSRFSMKDMGEADVILGIRIKHESNGITISQSHYIEKVLKKFNYFDCSPVSTLMDTSEKLMPNNGQAVSQLEYSRVIGCLMYAMTCTRPDIASDVGKLSMYINNLVLKGYIDASWISNTEDNSSTSALAAAGKEDECAATLAKAYSQMYNGKSRHIGVRHSMIHELVMNGVVSIEFVRSQQNLAHHLTKGLARDLVIKSAKGMGLKSDQVVEC